MDIMDMKTRYIGCYTYFEKSDRVDMIDWSKDGELKIHHKVDYLFTDGYEKNSDGELVCCESFEISNNLFEILLNSIEGKPIKIKETPKPTLSNISIFVSCKDNMIYELIVDEANHIYFIRNFKNEDYIFEEYPYEVVSALVRGIDSAGYKKIEVS